MQNYMNCTSDCFRILPILQIWSPETTGYLQTSKKFSSERGLTLIKKRYRRLRCILKPKLWFAKKSIKFLGLWLGLRSKFEFCLKVAVLFVRPRTYCVCIFTKLHFIEDVIPFLPAGSLICTTFNCLNTTSFVFPSADSE